VLPVAGSDHGTELLDDSAAAARAAVDAVVAAVVTGALPS